MLAGMQADKQPDRQTGSQTKQTDRQAGRQPVGQGKKVLQTNNNTNYRSDSMCGIEGFRKRFSCISWFYYFSLKPQYEPLQQHPCVNDDMPNRIICGAIQVKADVKTFTETGVEFVDGTVAEDIDVVVLATGYSFGFPFIDKEVGAYLNTAMF